MSLETERVLSHLIGQYLSRNYDYLWLKSRLEKCQNAPPGSTLITGSSHALNAVREDAWRCAINCSMHSQDLYYDFLCARQAILSAAEPVFKRCFIIMGYYIAFQDLSKSVIMRERVIAGVYYPLFHDAHNWEEPAADDPWSFLASLSPAPPRLSDSLRHICEQAAGQMLLECGSYYSQLRPRTPLFDLNGLTWAQIPDEKRQTLGRTRAESHNRSFAHKESFEENKTILREFVHFLRSRHIEPIVVITPFTDEYNRFVRKEMKEAVLELLNCVPEPIHYIDFNQPSFFEPSDFMDTDHLNETGARKVSGLLADLFGA